jgi:hypothetical protein
VRSGDGSKGIYDLRFPEDFMTAWELLLRQKRSGIIPWSREKHGVPTNSELRRWLDSRSVLINGKAPTAKEEITFPIVELVYFPKSKSRVTII